MPVRSGMYRSFLFKFLWILHRLQGLFIRDKGFGIRDHIDRRKAVRSRSDKPKND